MLRRLLTPLALAALLVGAGCSDSTAPALRVGDVTYSHDEVMDEIAEWAGNPEVASSFGSIEGLAPNSYTSDLTTSVARYRIIRELVAAEAERAGVEPDEQNEANAIANIFGDGPDAEELADRVLGGFSDAYAASFMEHAAIEDALVEEMGGIEPFVDWVAEAGAEERVELSSRFGTWDAETQTVLPPEGPATSTTAVDPLAEPAPAG